MPGLPPTDSTSSTFSFDCLEIINTVEFSPFSRSSNLIAYGGSKCVALGVCKFGDEFEGDGDFMFEHITDFHHGTQVQGIAWSPRTSVEHLPATVQFCTIGGDKKLRHFKTSGKTDTSVSILSGHSGYINNCVFEPVAGELIASVSDDYTCRLWDVETSVQRTCIPLGSPGMAVGWNPLEPNKLMVAEKKGILRFYDLVSLKPIMSLSTGRVPLMDADWCPTDPLKVGAVALDDWLMWDISKSSLPETSRQAHPDAVCHFRWSNSHSNLFATSGRPGNQVNVYHTGHQKLPVCSSLKVGGGLSWHYNLPLCAAGGDKKVHMWAVEL